MSVYIGEVETFKDVEPSKEQALKILEEAAEVFGAWQEWQRTKDGALPHMSIDKIRAIMSECADVVQAVCNLVDAFGECAFDDYMEECAERNRARGRM